MHTRPATAPEAAPSTLGLPRVTHSAPALDLSARPLTLMTGYQGDQERNAMRGPGYWRTDASLFKKFRLAETKELEFRVESVNVFNHFNLGAPDSFIGSFDQSGKLNASPTLGRIFTTAW